MEFLYSPNRLNVATSRARCACVLVASPLLFAAECKSPAQMKLANAFCRYGETARTVYEGSSPVPAHAGFAENSDDLESYKGT